MYHWMWVFSATGNYPHQNIITCPLGCSFKTRLTEGDKGHKKF